MYRLADSASGRTVVCLTGGWKCQAILPQVLFAALVFSVQATSRLSVAQSSDSELTLSWEGNGILERSRDLQSSWEPVPDAISGWKAAVTEGSWFFRVRSVVPLQVTLVGEGAGAVQSTPEGLYCQTSCQEYVDEEAVIRLVATAEIGSVFLGWTGDFVGTGECELHMDGPKSVTATFGLDTPVGGFANGNFEQGPGVGWLQDPGNMIYTAAEMGVAPYSGQYAAWVGYHQDDRLSAAIGQIVTLPETVPVYLNFALLLYSEELCDPPWWDTFGVYAQGVAIAENTTVCSTGEQTWKRVSLDVSAYAGQSVLIGFEMSSVDLMASVALIDDVFLSGTPW